MKEPFSIWENLSLSEVGYAISKTDMDKAVKCKFTTYLSRIKSYWSNNFLLIMHGKK